MIPCLSCGAANHDQATICYQCHRTIDSAVSGHAATNMAPASFSWQAQGGRSDKEQSTAFVLAMLLGTVGADRFYRGQIKQGILKAFLCTGFICVPLVVILISIAKGNVHNVDDATFLVTGIGLLAILVYLGIIAGAIWRLRDRLSLGMGRVVRDAEGRPLSVYPVVGKPEKEQSVAFALSYFLGWSGIDRFYLGYKGLGAAKLGLLVGAFGFPLLHENLFVLSAFCAMGVLIWFVVDRILIGMGRMKDAKGNSLRSEATSVSS